MKNAKLNAVIYCRVSSRKQAKVDLMKSFKLYSISFVVFFLCLYPKMGVTKNYSLKAGAIQHDGIERTFHYYSAQASTPSKPLPLVIALHGGGKKGAADLAQRIDLNAYAQRYGFVALYPEGIDSEWNDGRGVSFRRGSENKTQDDVGFLSSLMDYFVKNMGIDPTRIYVMGVSNGGMMTYRIACERPEKIAAAAAVIANLPTNIVDQCRPGREVPILIMNGTEDLLMPWSGGAVAPIGRFKKEGAGTVISTQETFDFWARNNGCSGYPEQSMLPDRDESDNSSVRKIVYKSCQGAPVVLYKVIGGGHALPGMEKPRGFLARGLRRLIGDVNQDINASAEIWNFFTQFSR